MAEKAEKNSVYKCGICGKIVEVLHTGAGELVCCGKAMAQMEENATDAAVEKHVPVVEKENGRIRVIVGEALHPMQEDHFIEWIQVIAGGISYRKFLSPGDQPVAEFEVPDEVIHKESLLVREYCSLHGLWKA